MITDDGYTEKLQNTLFIKYFSDIKDHRINRKKLYPIEEILLVTLAGVICGADSWSDLPLLGQQKLDFFRQIFPFHNGIPCDDTFRRFYTALDPKSFQNCLKKWLEEIQLPSAKHIAIDGKTLRGSYDHSKNQHPLHMISAFCCDYGIVLGQQKTDAKSNEITAIPKLLDALFLKNAVVTLDAMGCQKKIARNIIDKEGDYILSLKKNQMSLFKEVHNFFESHKKIDYKERGYNFYEYYEVDKGHGRIEQRRCIAVSQIEWLTQRSEWKGLKTLIRVERTTESQKKITNEVVYYISSLPPENAEKLSKTIRRHWSIENELHWILDVTFKEDSSRIRTKNGTENMALMRHFSLNLLKLNKDHFKTSIAGLRKAAGWNNVTLQTILTPPF